jgi:hypothetical protein
MQDENHLLPAPKRTAWNKDRLIGAKPPLLANGPPIAADPGAIPCSTALRCSGFSSAR